MIVILNQVIFRPVTADDVDTVICAELPPDPTSLPEDQREQARRLEEIVGKNMIHGPCGALYPECPCMSDGKCTKGFPKPFVSTTRMDTDTSYPVYRRRSPQDGGRTMVIKRGNREIVVDNRWVVPYNPLLSLRFNAHINVEHCNDPRAAKYLYLYVTKGSDRVMVRAEVEGAEVDEVEEFKDRRSTGSGEAAHRLFAFPVAKKFPPVYALRIHLEEEQQVVFDEATLEDVLELQRDTELTAFFKYNALNPPAAGEEALPRYVDFPKKFTWVQKDKKWKVRAKGQTIGRVHSVSPISGDVFYLRMLLHHDHCRGKTSHTDLRTLDGVVCPTYQEVCRRLGLLQDDNEWHEALEQAAVTGTGPQLRELYVTILLFRNPANPRQLFDDHWGEWGDDMRRREGREVSLTETQLMTLVLLDIDQRLQSWEKNLATFSLHVPSADERLEVEEHFDSTPVLIKEELEFDVEEMKELVRVRRAQFTPEQEDVFCLVMAAVQNEQMLQLFLDARGGCGKTFLLNAVLAAVRSLLMGGCVALAMGTTGIAANLLLLGRTFHSRMKAPLTPTEDQIFPITGQSVLTQLLRMSKLLLIDEATMLHKNHMEALDRTLRDLLVDERPFAGKVLIMSGDFR